MTSSGAPDRPTVAIAHDYLTQRGGAERVVLSLARAFPEAPIYTTLYDPESTYPEFAGLDIRTSWLDRITPLRHHHRAALPVLPLASSSIRIDADVVIASSSGWAHGFRTGGSKVVYCYSPARWLYQSEAYVGDRPGVVAKAALKALGSPLKRWDGRAAASADRYLAISTVVRGRIADCYGIDAEVVPAPLSPELTSIEAEPITESWLSPNGEPFLLCVSRLLPYKNVDAVVTAMRLLPESRLVVVGRGPDLERLRAMAPKNVLMLQGLTDGQMRWLYGAAAALVAASYEDFGLTPLEAAAQGKPSAVLRAGGFLDTMIEGTTAVFFDAPHPQLIAAAIQDLSRRCWDAPMIMRHAATFSEDRFVARIETVVNEVVQAQRPERSVP